MLSKLAIASSLVAVSRAQQACSSTTETHPTMTWSKCAAGGTCTSQSGSVTIDANWRWTHTVSGSTNCYTGNEWDTSICTDAETCATACCLDGADYSGTYGATTSGNALNLQFVTEGPYSTNIGSRFFLMASDTTYQMFTLLGNEFTFDVDVSNLPCGLNGALYFVSMDEDGGMSRFPTNKAGAKYGTGYCDSQCPRDIKFIDGVANSEGWTPSSNDVNAGLGDLGSCCAEMDIWEANSISAAYTPHPCTTSSQHSCNGDACGGTYSADRYGGDCDPDGCDFNSYRQGNTTFYGPGDTIDTKSPLTVVTQFLTGTDGALSEIKRFYVQNSKVIPNSESSIGGVTGNSITTAYCTAQKAAFGDTNDFAKKGGLAQMGAALAKPMVLVMSLWDDHAANMLWLDSTYPVGSTAEGAARGTCATTSGVPSDVEKNNPSASVKYSNIKFGPIGSTFNSAGSASGSSSSSTPGATTKPTSTTTSSTSGATGTAPKWAQCGGIGYTGPTTCVAGTTCTVSNEYYSQCL
ncbi:glycoside hydrolase family 7 protein [Pseudomassariella vexata]|uniref:Glucanase n=1 Tax=Pseudomassariella vexata TaxID=1141098 RepID=A0A1Y2EBC3_9PEZI|nr:glycoside hydrolase family 7 protein [Pseudomassariella vexata]ORY68870.1 glycoside hydrolase family 7 protein [Pseudomassariella vexata]